MKINKLRSTSILLLAIIGLMISSFNHVDSLKPQDIPEADWADSIAAALVGSHIMKINDETFIVDSIPCASAGTNFGIFARLKEHSYVDCSTCRPRHGKPDPASQGHCTVVRKLQ